jgi:hypothetical protein
MAPAVAEPRGCRGVGTIVRQRGLKRERVTRGRRNLKEQVAVGWVDLTGAAEGAATGRWEFEGWKGMSGGNAANTDGSLQCVITPARAIQYDRGRERPRNGDVSA